MLGRLVANRRPALGLLATLALVAGALLPLSSASSAPAERGTFVVGFHALPDEARAGSYQSEHVKRFDEALAFAVVEAADSRGFQERAAHDPNVRYVQAEQYATADFAPNDPSYASQWAWAHVNGPAAWDVNRGSKSVIVAVVDTGVDSAHADLSANLLPGYDFLNNDPTPDDDCGHGTGVVGVVAATPNNGVGISGAGNVAVMPLKAMGVNSAGSCVGPFSAVASSIRYAVDHGARVISMSLGCAGCYDQPTNDAIEYAWSKGAILVASAGNNGPCTNCVSWPAAQPHVLAVAATDSSDAQAYFSSSGPEVDLAAPGKTILTTYRGSAYGYMSGTSLAAPHVSGAAALALSANPSLGNSQLWSLLTGTARDLAAAGKDDATGYGLLDMGRLLGSTGSAPPPAPNAAPTASFTASASGLNATVDGGASADAEGPIAKYRWSWGDGLSFDSGACPTAGHAYAAAGTYTITLTVTDSAGATSATTRTITVSAPSPSPSPSPAPSPGMHVGDISGMAKKAGKTEKLTWSVSMVDANGSPVAGATVSVTVGGQTMTATTSSAGVATFTLSVANKAGVTYSLCVTDAAAAGWTYDAAANVRSCYALTTI